MKKVLCYLLMLGFVLGCPSMAMAKPASIDFNFADIKGHWAEQQIQTCVRLDLMSGVGSNQAGEKLFAPESVVSRAQLAVVLQRTFQLDYGNMRFIKQPLASDYYGDVDDGDWYSHALVMCAINQVFDSQANFDPAGSVSRIEIAQAIQRSFKAKNINIPMILMMPIFNDTQNLNQEDSNAMVFVNNTGIMTGNEGYFRPSELLKRAELARILNRCTELMSIDENYNAQEITLRPGQTFTLSLASNPTTGFTWSLSDNWDKQILSVIGEEYLSEGKPPLVGQGGHQLFKFKALQKGKTELNLVYSRPWESVQAAKTFNIKLLVTNLDLKPAED